MGSGYRKGYSILYTGSGFLNCVSLFGLKHQRVLSSLDKWRSSLTLNSKMKTEQHSSPVRTDQVPEPAAAETNPTRTTLMMFHPNPTQDRSEAGSSQAWHWPKINDSVYELYKPSSAEPNIDVLFFHGLQLKGDSAPHFSTWRSRCDAGSIWPSDWLPERFPMARILTISYDGSIEKTDSAGRMDLYLVAESLLQDLLLANVGQACPVIFVGHSFGGLLIKKLCLLSAQWRTQKMLNFFQNIRGIFYYATPHHGWELTNVNNMNNYTARGKLVDLVKVLNKNLARLNQEFDNLCDHQLRGQVQVAGVGEILPADLGNGRYKVIVTEGSARHSCAKFVIVKEDHFSISRPMEKHDTTYQILIDFIGEIQDKVADTKNMRDEEGDVQPLPKTLVGQLASSKGGDIEKYLEDNPAIGLWGMGGIGKTTLSKAVFNHKRACFSYTWFIENVKLIPGTGIEFERRLLEHVYHLGKKMEAVSDISFFKEKDILLVLDDVEAERDIGIVRRLQGICSPRSRFILTSRDSLIMRKVEGLIIVNLETLDNPSSGILLRNFAVPHNGPLLEWQKACLEGIVKRCDGLPLTLEVIGQYLRSSQEKEVWEQTLRALVNSEASQVEALGMSKVMSKLKISYDSLGGIEKQMFVDIATIFHLPRYLGNSNSSRSWSVWEAKAAWRMAYGMDYVELRWKTLVDRSLVFPSTGEDSELRMHEHLRDLGRSLALTSRESLHIYDGRVLRALLHTQQASHFQSIHSIHLNVSEPGQLMQEACLLCTQYKWLQANFNMQVVNPPCYQSFSEIIRDTLWKMDRVKYVMLDNHRRCQVYLGEVVLPASVVVFQSTWSIENLSCGLSNKLAVLTMTHFVGKQLPDALHNFRYSLQCIDLAAPHLEVLPESLCSLEVLRELRLGCPQLKKLPEDFGTLSNLQKLELVECHTLKQLPDSLCKLKKLQTLRILSLQPCNLEELPQHLGRLENLKNLTLWCSRGRLGSLPDSLCELKSLQKLVLDAGFEMVPNSIGNLKNLTELEVFSDELRELPHSLGELENLETLSVEVREFSDSQGELENLETLSLRVERVRFEISPIHFINLKNLQILKISIEGVTRLPPVIFGNLGRLQRLGVSCRNLQELPSTMGRLKELQELNIYSDSVEVLPDSFLDLPALQSLRLRCAKLRNLPAVFTRPPMLKVMEVQLGPDSLPRFMAGFGTLEVLSVICNEIEHIEWLDGLKAIRKLKIISCNQLKSLPASLGELESLKAIRKLEIMSCNQLKSLPASLGELESLEELSVIRCPELAILPESLGHLKSLRRLILEYLPLKRIPSLSAIRSLEYLKCEGLDDLEASPNVPPNCQREIIRRGNLENLSFGIDDLDLLVLRMF
ncbi:hypothetical protein R1flu_002275 [Riccia fluitans]|uniref:NB-ARC domain-containing protein n=1 Tax=Riccia fluitans TaxID=41844 RepID=A0ABD1Y655_9MARC